MKTAISMPDETFADAMECARQLGLSRSAFITQAVRRHIDFVHADDLTRRIDAVLETSHDTSNEAAAQMGRRVAADSDW